MTVTSNMWSGPVFIKLLRVTGKKKLDNFEVLKNTKHVSYDLFLLQSLGATLRFIKDLTCE